MQIFLPRTIQVINMYLYHNKSDLLNHTEPKKPKMRSWSTGVVASHNQVYKAFYTFKNEKPFISEKLLIISEYWNAESFCN